MATAYAPETVQALNRMVKHSLTRWGMSKEAQAKLLNLSENATYLAADPLQRAEMIIRVQRPGYSSKEEIASELAWVKALGCEGVVSTAAPIKGSDGNDVESLEEDKLERLAVAFTK